MSLPREASIARRQRASTECPLTRVMTQTWSSLVRRQEPAGRLEMPVGESAVKTPGDRLRNGPLSNPLPIELELGRQSIQPIDDLRSGVAKLKATDDWGEGKFAFCQQRLRVDHQPRFAHCAQNVVSMQVLMNEDLLALSRRQMIKEFCCRIDQPLLTAPTGGAPVRMQIYCPFLRFVCQ